uniref:Prepilin leader peptidase/N-methyltransferase n=1 Tax=Candidatus Kentrum sp. UNK TaxID=2126344 RepID=A0A451ARH7_9GAMM|nr:MAG: type 4 prepilin peptidase 1 Aspartic peptidase. MEROPS family A24A [Candidatus Kentron sp. UNK]VFK73669.1 MAG: type 4 prepilin peptidase 1 Aspartic peptidase. MEROPS family A24A [Candidatus Kentron sp. UNK]
MSLSYYFAAHAPELLIVCTLLGVIVGSFLNVVILRLPVVLERDWRRQYSGSGETRSTGDSARAPESGFSESCQEGGICCESLPKANPVSLTDSSDSRLPSVEEEPFNLLVPRSRCPRCAHTLLAWENIPVLGYLLLRGRCSACHAPISARYPLIELLSGAVAGGVAWQFGFGIHMVGALLFTWTLIALAFIDLDCQQLPDEITLPALWMGLAFNLFGVHASIEDSVIGAIFGYGILWGVYWLFRLSTGKEGMGHGDFKLLAMVGAWLGWQALPATILISSVLGALVGIALLLRGRDRNIPIPFGPYLALAAWIALLWGENITEWYWGVLV